MTLHRVVIVGGGFAGLNAAKSIGRLPGVEVTLIDRRNFHLFQPLLYQVASGGLSPGEIAAPLRSVLSRLARVRVLLGEVTGFDLSDRQVKLANAAIPYDTLIVAAGAETHYFGHDTDWAPHAPGLKSIEDATEVRSRIFSAFEHAEGEPDEARRRQWLRFVVVGGGPTGVELAGAIAEIARDTLRRDFRRIRPEESEILLLEGGPRILPAFTPDLSTAAERSLIGLGVRPRTGIKVTGIDATGVRFERAGSAGEERIDAATVIWAAGVRASSLGKALAAAAGIETDRGGRIAIGADLSVPGHPEILALGDMARCEQDGQPLPGVSPVAMQQGWHAAKVIAARIAGQPAPAFRYFDKGTMATMGRAAAVVDLGFVRFSGWFAWLTWLFVHLLYLVGFRNRLAVALQWAFQYSTFNRGARLITGAATTTTRPDR